MVNLSLITTLDGRNDSADSKFRDDQLKISTLDSVRSLAEGTETKPTYKYQIMVSEYKQA